MKSIDSDISVEDAIRHSAQSFYQRITHDLTRPIAFEQLSALCSTLTEELRGEVLFFGPVLRPLVSHAAALFTETVMAWFHADFEASVRQIKQGELPEQALRLGTAVDMLQAQLLQHQLVSVDRLIDTESVFSPLRIAWVSAQQQNFHSYLDRIMRQENWQPVDSFTWNTTSAVDFFSMIHQSLSVFCRVLSPIAPHIHDVNDILYRLIECYCRSVTRVCIQRVCLSSII